MVRYIKKHSDASEGTANNNIISKAIQQEIQKKQEGLSPEEEHSTNKGGTLQEKNLLIETLQEEKKSLQTKIDALKQDIHKLQEQIQQNSSDMPPETSPSKNKDSQKLQNTITQLESQLVQANQILAKKDAQIIALSESHQNDSAPSGGLLKNILIILFILFIGASMSFIFFTFQPPEYEAHISINPNDVPGMNSQKISADSTLSLIKQPQILTQFIEQNEILPIEKAKKNAVLTKLIEKYQKRISVDLSQDKKTVNLYYVDKSPQKSARFINYLANAFIQNTVQASQKQNLNQELENTTQEIAEAETGLKEAKNVLEEFNQISRFQPISLPTYQKLKNKSQNDFSSIRDEIAPINSQIQRLEAIQADQGKSELSTELSQEKISESPILNNLLNELEEKEFYRAVFLLDNPPQHPILREQAKYISQLKADIVDMTKVYLNKTFTPDEENELTLKLMSLFLKTKQQALDNLLNGHFLDEKSREENLILKEGQLQEIKEIENNLSILQDRKEAIKNKIQKLDDQSMQFLTLTSPSNTKLSLQSKILYLLFCLIGLPLGLLLTYFFLLKKTASQK